MKIHHSRCSSKTSRASSSSRAACWPRRHQHPHAVAGRHAAVRHPAPDRFRLAGGREGAARGRLRRQRHRGGGRRSAGPSRRAGRAAGLLEAAGVNIEYMYAFTFGRGDKAVLIFRFDEPDAAIELLQGRGHQRARQRRSLQPDRAMSVSQNGRRAARARLLDPPHVRGRRAAEGRSAARRTSSTSPWATRMWSRPRR